MIDPAALDAAVRRFPAVLALYRAQAGSPAVRVYLADRCIEAIRLEYRLVLAERGEWRR